MARTQTTPWRFSLSARPNRVHRNDPVELTVTLRHLGLDVPDAQELRAILFQHFHYRYESTDHTLNESLSRINPHRNPAVFSVPDIPEGEYDIVVHVHIRREFYDNPIAAGDTIARLGIPAADEIVESAQTTISVIQAIETESKVTLQRTFAGPTDDRALWPAIRNRTAAIGFDRYTKFIDCIFCQQPPVDIDNLVGDRINSLVGDRCLDTTNPEDPTDRRQLSIYGPYAYSVLKLATQVFLTLESGVVLRKGDPKLPKIFDIQKERIRANDFSLSLTKIKNDLQNYISPHDQLPYLDRIVRNLITLDPQNIHEVLPYCLGVLQHRLTSPSLIELIWSYWLEEGMLVQTMNAIARRFQNRRGSPNDPLGELEFDPLRPLNNLIWGFIQDEHNRLTVPRRAHEYLHHYGLSLMGKAVPDLNPADTRSKFIEGFHNLLSATARFFRDDSDTTVIADAFPLLNALKDVHLLLAEGAHNQFGDLTWTARAEMMTTQWMLARPEMKEFLRGRYMVPYQEDWMGAVDSMKKLQGWTDTTITHFYELAVTGERILLSIRYGDWSDIENIEDQAKNWARSCRPEIQRYIYAYKTVAGVDLAADLVDSRDAATRYLQPSVLLQRRLREQRSALSLRARRARNALPPGPAPIGALPSGTPGYTEAPIPSQRRLLRLTSNR
jgi:hypothetical protein